MVTGNQDYFKSGNSWIDHRFIKGVDLLTPTVSGAVPTSIENTAIAYDTVNDRFKVDIEAWTGGDTPADVTDRWARQLGQVDLARVLGAALAHANPVISRLTDGSAFIDPRDVSDRAARLLGIIYGSEGQQILQRATTYDTLVQLRHAGAEIDPRDVSDRAARELGIVYGSQSQQLLQRAATYDSLVQLRHAGAEIDPRDVSDRAARELGLVYGSQGAQLKQRATSLELIVQLAHAASEIDPRNIRALTSSDVVDVSDRAARDMGKVDIAGHDVALPAGSNLIGKVDVDSHPLEGTANRRYSTSSGELVAAPGSGNKLRVYGFMLMNESDEISRLRYNGAAGTVFAALPSKGCNGMNLINLDEAGGDNQNIYHEKTASGNSLAVVYSESVTV